MDRVSAVVGLEVGFGTMSFAWVYIVIGYLVLGRVLYVAGLSGLNTIKNSTDYMANIN